MDYLKLSKDIAKEVKSVLFDRLKKTGFIGDTNLNPGDLKSTHEIDIAAINIINNILKDIPCNIYMESESNNFKENAEFSIYIDPVDGSLNWDRGVGDPCIVIAITEKIKNPVFSDLSFAYVEGFRSGDLYYTKKNRSIFYSNIIKKEIEINCKKSTTLSESTAYLRPGYSMVKNQFKNSFPLFLKVKDIRAVDNAGIEICEIARNAADFMVEGRGGSDFFNLLAYPILKNAGGDIYDLNGISIADKKLDTEINYNYIASSNKNILSEILNIMKNFKINNEYKDKNISFSYED